MSAWCNAAALHVCSNDEAAVTKFDSNLLCCLGLHRRQRVVSFCTTRARAVLHPPPADVFSTHVGVGHPKRPPALAGHAHLTPRATPTRTTPPAQKGLRTASAEQTTQRHSFRARRHQPACRGAIALYRQRICQFGARLCRERWAREKTFSYAAGRAGYARRARYEDAVFGTAELEQHHH